MKTTHIHGGCLNCPQTEEMLDLDTVLYNGFGGYKVTKNSKTFYEADPSVELPWEKYWKLSKIEKIAQNQRGKWRVILNNPLRGATWERKGKNKWVLIESNQGFA